MNEGKKENEESKESEDTKKKKKQNEKILWKRRKNRKANMFTVQYPLQCILIRQDTTVTYERYIFYECIILELRNSHIILACE